MIVRWPGVVMGVVLACGCKSEGDGASDDQPPGDATPTAMYDSSFAAATWSMAVVDGRAQISITDQTGDPACALGVDQRNHLPSNGGQIILQLPDAATDACPVGSYTLTKCTNDIGNDAFVPAGCAYYRAFDVDGKVSGVAPAIDATVQIAGSDHECTLRVSVGFYGASFTEEFSMMDSPATPPWCDVE